MAALYWSMATAQASLASSIGATLYPYEPTDFDPIKPIESKPRLSGKITQRGAWGIRLIFDDIDEATMARLRLVAGGAGSASAMAYIQMPDLEPTSGTEDWGQYYGWADRPVAGKSVGGFYKRVMMTWRKLERVGDAVAV